MRSVHGPDTGLSLVELLVAMVISLLLLGGIYSLFQNSSANYRMQAGLSRIQESGRFAIDFLKRDIRRSGYQGCSSYGPLTNTLNDKDAWAYNFEVAIEGYDNVGSSVADLGGLETLPGTDVVVIRTSIEDGVSIVDNNNSAQLFVKITKEEPDACADDTDRVSGICDGDIVMVSDCKKSRVFQAGNIQVADDSLNVAHPASGDPGNAISSWGGASAPEEEQFGTDAELIKFATIIYFVRNNAADEPALYRKLGKDNAQEMVEGVESMQVLYGVDTDNNHKVNEYLSAADVADWEKVRSVRVGFLQRTPDPVRGIEDDDNVYQVLNEELGPYDDDRMRRVFTSTIGLRNRLQ